MSVTVVIPVERGCSEQWSLPEGTQYKLVEHDPGERSQALDAGVQECTTTFVLPFVHDAVLYDEDLQMLVSCSWNNRAAYPSLIRVGEDNKPISYRQASPYCPHRLLRENYVGPAALVRRDSYLAAGGWGLGPWDLWLRLGRMRCVGEAKIGLRSMPDDPTPPPVHPPALATFYSQASYPTTYYRCQLASRYLPGVVRPNVPDPVEQNGSYCFPEQEGTAVWQFPGDKVRATVIAWMQLNGTRVLAEVDDNYIQHFETQAKAGWVFDADDERSQHSIEQHRAIVAACDGVICASEYLAAQYRKLNPNIYVCPNQIDPCDWPPHEKPDDGVFRVGWFASHSHRGDGKLIESSLRWLKGQKNVEVVLMGAGATKVQYKNTDGEVVKIENRHWFPFLQQDGGAIYRYTPQSTDLEAYWKLMMSVDIGLNPVVPNHWSLARSDVKGLEYAMAGACPVLSDVPAYENWQDGVGCLKAGPKPSDWLRSVQSLVRNPERAKELAAQAREYVLAERTAEHNAWRWQEAVAG